MPAAIPYIPALVMAAGSGMQAYGASKSARKAAGAAQQREQEARQYWEQKSRPDPRAIQAQRLQSRAGLSSAKGMMYENLAKQLAARGISPGSGLMAGEAGKLEASHLRNLGNLEAELTKTALTPMFAPPGYAPMGAIAPNWLSGTGGAVSDIAGTYMGMEMMKKLLAQSGDDDQYTTYTPPYKRDQYGMGYGPGQ